MAGDWIKVRTVLPKDGRVRKAAKILKKGNALGNASTNAYCVTVFGGLVTLWSFADSQADENGLISGYDFDDINEMVGIDGFCESLSSDWVIEVGDDIQLVDYKEHNGKSAKVRSQTAKRVANAKANAKNVTEVTQQPLLDALPREEKRREELKEGGDVPSPVSTSSKCQLKTYLKRCDESGVDPIPDDSIVFKNADALELPHDLVLVGWEHFKNHWLSKPAPKTDWVATFNNCLKDDGYGAYRRNASGEWFLTTKGKNTQILLNSGPTQ